MKAVWRKFSRTMLTFVCTIFAQLTSSNQTLCPWVSDVMFSKNCAVGWVISFSLENDIAIINRLQ